MTGSSLTRRLLVGTTVLSVPLILLGIYTAIAGFGLTCEARWPLCDGAVFGLFPANWGSFVEWFHRLVAMVFGFAIVGTVLSVRRDDVPRLSRLAVYGAAVLTPLQIVFGALTVGAYEPLVLATHFVTAISIFLLLAVGAVGLYTRTSRIPSIRRLAGLAAVLLVVALPLVPGSAVAARLGVSPPGIYVVFYLFTLLATGALLIGAVESGGRQRATAFAGVAVVVTIMVLSRIALFPTTTLVVFLGLLGGIGAAAGVALLETGAGGSGRRRVEPGD